MTSDQFKKTNFHLIPLIIILDQLSKYLAGNYSFIVACNRGIAFGIGSDATLTAAIVLVLVFLLMVREKGRFSNLGFALIFAGGLSNLTDRIIFSCVRDFITVSKFPSFNLADMVITAGVFLLVSNFFGERVKVQKSLKNNED